MAKKKTGDKDAIESVDSFEDALDLINSEFGTGTLIDGAQQFIKVDVFPSGVPSIDVALGCKGIPQGRVIEIYGLESSGKTTTCLQLMAACQKFYFPKKERFGRVVLIDAEHAFDPNWAEKIGVDLSKVAISQPSSGEEGLRIAEKLVKSKKVDLIVVDSVAALTPQSEIDGEIGDSSIGAQARMMSQAMRKLVSLCSKTSTTIIFINQIREKIGVMFGNPETTPGGKALKFYASVRGSISKGSALKDGDDVIGFRPTLKFVKNKVGRPFTTASFDICVGHKKRPVCGIDGISSLIDVAVSAKIITKNGNHFKYGGTTLGNGLTQSANFLRENPKIAEKVREETYSEIFGNIDQAESSVGSIDDELIDDDQEENDDDDDLDMQSIDEELIDDDN